jgi:nicotinamidase-related amidase
LNRSTKALVIVHLSSLDSYAAQSREASGSWVYAEELSQELEKAIRKHKGPIFIVDQGWPMGRRESEYRGGLVSAIARRRNVTWIIFDENVDSWPLFLQKLEAGLKKKRVTSVVLGGVWKEGCVQAVFDHLKEHTDLDVCIAPELVGSEEDYEHEWPE